MALKMALLLALVSTFYCHEKVFCNELGSEFSIKLAAHDKEAAEKTFKNSRMRRDSNNGKLIKNKTFEQSSFQEYLNAMEKMFPTLRGKVQSINGKLYFPPKPFFYVSEDGKHLFDQNDFIDDSGDDNEIQKNLDGYSGLGESNRQENWSKNAKQGFQHYEGNAIESPLPSITPIPPFLSVNQGNDNEDKVKSYLHYGISNKFDNSDVDMNAKHEIVNVRDIEMGNPLTKGSGENGENYCENNFLHYVPLLPISSCHSHFTPKPLIINLNSECFIHPKHDLNCKSHRKVRRYNTMFS